MAEVSNRQIPAKKSVNAEILKAILRHRTHLVMLENNIADKVQKILRPALVKLMKELGQVLKKRLVEARIWEEFALVEAEGSVARTFSSSSAKKIADEIVANLKRRFDGPIDNIDDVIAAALLEVAQGEIEIVSGILQDKLHAGTLNSADVAISDEVPRQVLEKLVNTSLGGQTYSDRLVDRYGDSLSKIKTGIFQGIVNGDGINTITQAIALEVATVLPKSIERLVRTELMRVANSSLLELYSKNSDIVKKVQFVATLDWRTCFVCGQYDGHVYNINDAPELPIHPHCRCLLVPITKSWSELGADREDVPDSVRASMNGTVPASTTFVDFFQDQDEIFQRRVLGDTRYDLWSRGSISLDQLATRQRIRSIAELKALAKE